LSAVCLEALLPNIRSRIEQSDGLSRFGIEAGDIRPFVTIAIRASQGQITLNCSAAVLFGSYVVDLKRQPV
jgi:hypothetical protein